MGAVAPRTAAIRSAGAASIWAPIRPAETRMVGWARQLKSNTVLYCFFHPDRAAAAPHITGYLEQVRDMQHRNTFDTGSPGCLFEVELGSTGITKT